ncbi:hypothetical protein GIB67_041984, partial [Kingdonia uniflora]
ERMSDTVEESGSESLIEKIQDKIHHHDVSSSSSDSESENNLPSRKNRLFGRQKPVHSVLGGGKSADIILWRDKQISACILTSVTVIWLLFEWLGYHLLTFVCHSLILSLAILFLWSNLSSFVNKSPPKFPEIMLPEDLFVSVALSLRYEVNRAFITFREVASGKDLKKFLMVIAGLWVLSVVGSWFNFLTLFYLVFVILHTVPVLYEKHEDHVDTLAEKAIAEMNKQYAVLDEKVLQKLPKYSFINKDNKQH